MSASQQPLAGERWARFLAAFACGYLAMLPSAAQLIGVACLVTLVMRWPPAPWQPLGVRRVLASYPPFAVLWFVLMGGYLWALHALGHSIPPQSTLTRLAENGASDPSFAFLLLVVVVWAPVVEEIIFRGYLFAALRVSVPMWATHLLTAGLFGLVHGLDYALPIGVLALLFGYLRHRCGSLLPSIFAHALHNGLTVALTVCWPEHLEWLYPK